MTITDEISNEDFRERLGEILERRRKRRAEMLELADGAFLQAIELLDRAGALRARAREDAEFAEIAADLESIAGRLEHVELEMRAEARNELDAISSFEEQGHFAARERELVEKSLAIAHVVAAGGGDPDSDADFLRLVQVQQMIEAERQLMERLAGEGGV